MMLPASKPPPHLSSSPLPARKRHLRAPFRSFSSSKASRSPFVRPKTVSVLFCGSSSTPIPACRKPHKYFGGTVGTTSDVLKTRQVLGTSHLSLNPHLNEAVFYKTPPKQAQSPPNPPFHLTSTPPNPAACLLHSTHNLALPTLGAPKVTHTTSAPLKGLSASTFPTSEASPKSRGRPRRLRATSRELIVARAPPKEWPVKMI